MIRSIRTFLLTLLLSMPLASYALTPISDSEMAATTGQALLTSDYIAPNSLTGQDGITTNFGFYRMGLDATVETNINIDKLQLGCGGFNNNIKVGCDIDLDFVSMLGLSDGSASVQPTAASSGQLDAFGNPTRNEFAGSPATSGFLMTRPYLTIAVANPDNPQQREVVGFKFGAQSVSGYMGIGRVYQNGQTNLETGETCTASNGNSLGCHSGLNSLSGYMHVKVSGALPLQGKALGISNAITNPATEAQLRSGAGGNISNACFGATDYGTNCHANSTDPITADISGTRINTLNAVLPTNAHVRVLGILTLDLNLITNLSQNLRFIHGFATENTGDFFLSFQRQQVSWPTYDKTGYAVTANAGWWMNIPEVSSENLIGATLNPNADGVPSVLNVSNLELRSVPPINCYGNYRYC